MEVSFGQIGLILQILGVVIILIAQFHFLWKLWRKWKNLNLGFLDIVATRVMSSDEKLKAMTKKELSELFKKFPLALWLRSNFMESIAGLSLTLSGLLIELLIQGSVVI